jgi:hypothetical protein
MHRKLRDVLGADAGDELVNLLEVAQATRGDIAELRHEMELRFTAIEGRFTGLEGRFAAIDARFDAIDARFGAIGERFDTRFDAIGERFDARCGGIEAKFPSLRAELEAGMKGSIEAGLKEQTRFFFLAWAVQLAAIVGLYAR